MEKKIVKLFDVVENYYIIMNDGKISNYYRCPMNDQIEDACETVTRNEVVEIAMAIGHHAVKGMEQAEMQFAKYPLHLKRKVREHAFDLDEHDITKDDRIEEMSSQILFRHVCRYEGLLGSYSEIIMDWVHDIFDVDLREIKR